MSGWRAIGVASMLLVGCGDDAPLPEGVVEIGTGLTGWEPIAPGQDLEVVAGPQGGFHLVVSARIRDLEPGNFAIAGDPGNPATSFSGFLAPDRRPIHIELPAERTGYIESDGDSGWYEIPAPSMRLLMIQNDEIPGVYGETIRIEVSVTDANGRVARDERTVVAVQGQRADAN